ncbi:MAG TPA: RtcB family protein [Desulfobulbus sp.]|nr:RtcB family protein [Desulfobulbus sp.]
MKKQLTTEKIPICLWLDDIEEGALEQARHLANLPFAFHHVAIMPDAHQGYGMPIGGVLATRGVVIPNAVGVDIGCGMCAVRTSLGEVPQEMLRKVMSGIRRAVPLGFKHHPKALPADRLPPLPPDPEQALPVVAQEFRSARAQVGTLGGGNHFIEIQRGSEGRIWIMVHSGSRNLGYKVAGHYNRLAVRMAPAMRVQVPRNWQLAYLPLDSREGNLYLEEMRYCVEFALANRREMMERIQEVFVDLLGPVDFGDLINIAHNYAALERHYGQEVMVHRKGSTRARRGETGIIPGSQGSVSYIVRGLGNPASFHSCSHGAGRIMGRRQAQRVLDLAEEKKKLDSRHILHAIRHRRDLDEAPGAYKDIGQVMRNQEDLVEIVEVLQPLAVIKG